MIAVEEAQARLLALASALSSQTVLLEQAIGHYLAEDVVARRSQPATDLSAMDGYAVRFADLPGPFHLVGVSAAGTPYSGEIATGQTARIFTGAHVPAGANTILLQEEARADGDVIFLNGDAVVTFGKNVRREGADFKDGDILVRKGTLIEAGVIAAAAIAGYGKLVVGRAPRIKIIATGDELMQPGQVCDAAHIPSSNNIMLTAMLRDVPCQVVDAGIVRDDLDLITAAFADAAEFDIIVSTGGASVGDHDFVQAASKAAGAQLDFWRIAMRPGKPLMAARIGKTVVLGLPGNPSSAFVTAILFLLPFVRHLAGSKMPLPQEQLAPVGRDLHEGDARAEFMRARFEHGTVFPFNCQGSGMVMPLTTANALIIRRPFAAAIKKGEITPYLAL